jgi:hypothetical protein
VGDDNREDGSLPDDRQVEVAGRLQPPVDVLRRRDSLAVDVGDDVAGPG